MKLFGMRAKSASPWSPRVVPFACALGFVGALLGSAPAGATESYPSRPIRLIIGFSAGGNTDVMGRAAALEMSKALGQPIVVENKVGGAGSVMADTVIASPPDGYTMCLCGSGPQVLLPLIDPSAKNYPRDLQPVSLLYANDYVLIGKKDLKPNTVQELIADIKANPGQYTFGSSGIGGIQQLGLELLSSTLGAKMLHVPYKGEQPAAVDVAAGLVDLLLATPTTAEQMLKTGRVKAFAVTGAQPNALVPNLPTLVSAGFPDVTVYTFGGLNVARGTPPEIVDKLSKAAAEAVKSPAYLQRVREGGMFVPVSGPAAYADFVSKEIKRWSGVTKSIDFKRQ